MVTEIIPPVYPGAVRQWSTDAKRGESVVLKRDGTVSAFDAEGYGLGTRWGGDAFRRVLEHLLRED